MEKNTPIRKTHTSTADLLIWPETPSPADPPLSEFASRPSLKPIGGITPALFGGPMTEEEAESVNRRKQSSGLKLREMTGSGIFAAGNEISLPDSLTNPCNKTSVKIYQQSASQISFSTDETISPRKPASLPEVAKQRELSGNLESEAEAAKTMRQLSGAKSRELSGHDIFGPPREILLTGPSSLAPRNLQLKGQLDLSGDPAPPQLPQSMHTTVKSPAVPKTSKKINNQKLQDLSGNDIFGREAVATPTEKPLSSAKLKEMSGSDIFADGKAASRDYFGGVRKPPGGGSSIALV